MQRTTLIITHFCHLWKAKCRLKLSALFMKAWLMTGECLSFQAGARMFVADSHRGTRRSLAKFGTKPEMCVLCLLYRLGAS